MYIVYGISDLSHEEALFMAAVSNMDKDRVSELIGDGVDVNCRHPHGQTALHIAAYNTQEDLVRLLLLYGVEVDVENKHGQTALHLAASRGSLPVVEQLVEADCDIDLQTGVSEMAALHFATIHSHADIIEYLLEKRANADLLDCIGKKAEYYAKTERIRELFGAPGERTAVEPEQEPETAEPVLATTLETASEQESSTDNREDNESSTEDNASILSGEVPPPARPHVKTTAKSSSGSDSDNKYGAGGTVKGREKKEIKSSIPKDTGPRKKHKKSLIVRKPAGTITDKKFEYSEEHQRRMKLSVYDRLAGGKKKK